MHLEIIEHPIYAYNDRTKFNATQSDMTIAFAVDFDTAGERLTKSFAKSKLVEFNMKGDFYSEFNKLLLKITSSRPKIINIAGNGIYTMIKHGFDQDKVDKLIFMVLNELNRHCKFQYIYSGGQTGADLAGARAAIKMNIPTKVTFPKGYRIRNEDGKDVTQTYEQALAYILKGN